MITRITISIAFIAIAITISAQSIITKEVEVQETDSTFVFGQLKLDASLTIEGSAAAGGGRIFFKTDKPRILFKETDQADDNYKMQVNQGNLTIEATDDGFGTTGLGMTMEPDGHTTFNSGIQITNGFI